MGGLDHRSIETKSLSQEPFPQVNQEFRVFISEEAFDRAVERGSADLGREVGGILVGRVLRDGSGPYVQVDTTIDALHADEKTTEVTFTHTTWDHIHKEMDSRHGGKAVIGWYHTHPGFGVFLSDRDLFIHKSFFNLPFQIALVYDPKKREHGVFAWRDGEPWRCRRYWIGSHEETWDGPRTPPEKTATSVQEIVEGGGREGRSPQETGFDLLGLSLTAAAFLVLGCLLGWFLGGRYGPQGASGAEVETAKARLSEMEAAMKTLNAELLSLVGKAIDFETTGRTASECTSTLEEGIQLVASAGGDPSKAEAGLGKIRGVRDRLRDLRETRSNAKWALDLLEAAARRASLDPKELARELLIHRGAIGSLYREMALDKARAGDKRGAEVFLMAAAKIDPENRGVYEKTLQSFEEGGKLPAPPPPAASLPPAEKKG